MIRGEKKKGKNVKEGRVITWYFRGRESGPDFRVGVINTQRGLQVRRSCF